MPSKANGSLLPIGSRWRRGVSWPCLLAIWVRNTANRDSIGGGGSSRLREVSRDSSRSWGGGPAAGFVSELTYGR